MKVKDELFERCSFIEGNGEETRFSEDTRLADKTLAQQYPSLYGIVQRKQANVMS
jgi:hypothetical protein